MTIEKWCGGFCRKSGYIPKFSSGEKLRFSRSPLPFPHFSTLRSFLIETFFLHGKIKQQSSLILLKFVDRWTEKVSTTTGGKCRGKCKNRIKENCVWLLSFVGHSAFLILMTRAFYEIVVWSEKTIYNYNYYANFHEADAQFMAVKQAKKNILTFCNLFSIFCGFEF